MSEHEDQSGETPAQDKRPGRGQSGGGNDAAGVSAGRRRLLKGAAGSAPFVMTVAGRPAFGAACSPSTFASGNASSPGTECQAGYTPGAYKTPERGDGVWPAGYEPGGCIKRDWQGRCYWPRDPEEGTLFSEVFPDYGGNYSQQFRGLTLLEVLWLPQSTGGERDDRYEFGAHIIAALFNAINLPGYGLRATEVEKIFREVEVYGSYEPMTGVRWSAQEVVAYLQSTMV